MTSEQTAKHRALYTLIDLIRGLTKRPNLFADTDLATQFLDRLDDWLVLKHSPSPPTPDQLTSE